MILIADDNSILRELIMESLIEEEIVLEQDIISCSNGKEVIDFCQKNSSSEIDLVILDLQMPIMNGYECCIELRKINPTVKIIIMSGSGNLEEKEIDKYKKENGILEYFVKPFDFSLFLNYIKEEI